MDKDTIVDYIIGDPNSNRFLLFFKICQRARSRLLCLSCQHEILRPNPRKANQCVLIVKHKLTYMQGRTYTLLDKYAQAWL